ncbi:glycosyltransferase family 2 protein [Nocardioides seonyuensis]|uniref:glycosyltransferase family 2 protein n=1 Tax=Nocardioides seonyuensis TaxID=2518371 RepID=UPI00141FF615|nr:glycosyltransferase family 2 protein [Nocardioides seonyuensis]
MSGRTIPQPTGLAGADDPSAEVVVACVTYNSASVIEPFLAALPAALVGVPGSRVVVVDNASSDDTVATIEEVAPWVTVVRAPGNVGYAAGINLALRQCTARRGVYVLNPDAVPSPGSVAHLLAVVEADPEVGIAVPTVLSEAGEVKFSLRREPTILRAAGEAVLGGHRAARHPWLGDQVRDSSKYVEGATADWATGAALFLSRAVLDAVGSWDERFFLYSEETDYALRARDEGFRVQLTTAASVTHPGGEMESSPELWTLVAVNRQRLYRKRHALVPSVVYWAVVLANESVRALLGRPRSRLATQVLLRLGPDQTGADTTPALIARTPVPWHVGRTPGSTPAT